MVRSKLQIFTIILFFIMVIVRIEVRNINALWIDEIYGLSGLTSLEFLVRDYLPKVPGGAPGHYLLLYPLQQFFPSNKFILGIPGFAAHIFVFVIIPVLIKKLQIVSDTQIPIVAFIARIGFVLEPTFTFQAMEIRPWGLLPFLWSLSVVLIYRLMQIDINKGNIDKSNLISTCTFLWILLIGHYYTAIMMLSIYGFFLYRQRKYIPLRLFKLKSFYCFGVTFFSSLPFWVYFAKDSFVFQYNTWKTIPVVLMQMYALDKGFPKGILIQNVVYFGFILFMLSVLFLIGISFFKKSKKIIYSVYKETFFQIIIFLVFLPGIIIFSLDLFTKYMFLYRQIVWLMLPFYIAIATVVVGVSKKATEHYS